jgi:hypothetical protein
LLLEKYEKELLKNISQKFTEKEDLSSTLTDINDIKQFFQKLSNNQNNQEDKLSQYILLYIYYKFSEKEVRLRKVTSRNFEDFVANIYGLSPTDDSEKPNPLISQQIQELHNEYENLKTTDEEIRKYMIDEDGKFWSIAEDLSSNKREKADIVEKIENVNIDISIKTLKGKVDRDTANTEINIGSLSYRSLFVGIHNQSISDRKAGLGSGKQMIKLLNKIKENGKLDDFKKRLKLFLEYLYNDDDFLIAFKSDKKMQILFFKGEKLVNLILELLDLDLKKFSEIFYRWENNNLRIQINKLINPNYSKFWEASHIDEIKDYPKYENIENPFSKSNLVILNMSNSLGNPNLTKILEESNKEFIAKFYEKIIE